MTTGEGQRRGGVARVIVVGAGIVGLSCAWSLQEFGLDVQVVDRHHVGAGASWQNAGYVCPALCVPLPEPAILRYGVRAVLRPGSPVGVVWQADPRLARFLADLARHCTSAGWTRSLRALRPLNELVVESYERQRQGGVQAELHRSDVFCCFEDERDSAGLLHELDGVRASGQRVETDLLRGDEARSLEPHLTRAITVVVRLRGQQYLTPSSYVGALATSVRERGGKVTDGVRVTSATRRGGAVVITGPTGTLEADAVVLATGAWLGPLVAPHGVRVPVYGGRGYSFTVAVPEAFRCPLQFSRPRVAMAPQGDRLRVTGMMEFGSPDAPPSPSRIPAIVKSVTHLVDGVDWSRREDEWMGPRPLTTDGLPLVGETRTPGVFVAGGHGMWGVTLGPLTGALLARQVATGVAPPELAPLAPTR